MSLHYTYVISWFLSKFVMANIFTDIEFTLVVHRLVVPKVYCNIQLALRSIPFVIPHAKYSPNRSCTRRRHTDTTARNKEPLSRTSGFFCCCCFWGGGGGGFFFYTPIQECTNLIVKHIFPIKRKSAAVASTVSTQAGLKWLGSLHIQSADVDLVLIPKQGCQPRIRHLVPHLHAVPAGDGIRHEIGSNWTGTNLGGERSWEKRQKAVRCDTPHERRRKGKQSFDYEESFQISWPRQAGRESGRESD